MAEPEGSTAAARIAFQYPSFVLFQTARFLIVLASEMQSVAVGWQVYEITKRPLDLGLVGLAQFLPGILLFLVSGHVADRYDRRKLIVCCYVGFAVCCSSQQGGVCVRFITFSRFSFFLAWSVPSPDRSAARCSRNWFLKSISQMPLPGLPPLSRARPSWDRLWAELFTRFFGVPQRFTFWR